MGINHRVYTCISAVHDYVINVGESGSDFPSAAFRSRPPLLLAWLPVGYLVLWIVKFDDFSSSIEQGTRKKIQSVFFTHPEQFSRWLNWDPPAYIYIKQGRGRSIEANESNERLFIVNCYEASRNKKSGRESYSEGKRKKTKPLDPI